jgi:hypothetical protein
LAWSRAMKEKVTHSLKPRRQARAGGAAAALGLGQNRRGHGRVRASGTDGTSSGHGCAPLLPPDRRAVHVMPPAGRHHMQACPWSSDHKAQVFQDVDDPSRGT